MKALPTMELGKLVADMALNKALLPGISSNRAACEREIGRRLSPYVGETFTAPTATETISYRLTKKADRWEGKHVSNRYVFEEVKRTPVTNQGGVMLEEQAPDASGDGISQRLARPVSARGRRPGPGPRQGGRGGTGG
jgi:hypothetical protein